MQLNRLFEMVYLLLEHKTMTAKELAAYFEVSSRTIYRDIETLSQAGIPIYTVKGSGGGIRLAEQFTLKSSLLSHRDQQEILSALQGLSALPHGTDTAHTLSLLHRLSGAFQTQQQNWLEVDLSDWSERHKELYETLKQAILQRHVITFDYYASNGQMSVRHVEPLQLWFKSKSWYLRAFCLEKGASRIFRLTRMKRVELSEQTFPPRDLDFVPPLPHMQHYASAVIRFTMRIDASQAYRIYDDFEEEEIVKNPDGSFLVRLCYPKDDWLYGLILSYGIHGTVLEPEHLRGEIQRQLEQMLQNYRI